MKKNLLLAITLMMCAAGINAQNHCKSHRYPSKADQILQLDSIHTYETADSNLFLRSFNVLDTQNMIARTTDYGTINGDWGIYNDTLRYLDQNGNVTLMKTYMWDGDDMELYLTDSVIYTYGNKVTYEMDYSFYQEELSYIDSVIINSDNEGRDTLAVTWRLHTGDQEWTGRYKEVWRYDSNGNLTYYDYCSGQTAEGAWKPNSRQEYFYENNVDTLQLIYSTSNPQGQLLVSSRWVSTLNSFGKKDLMYKVSVQTTGEVRDTVAVDTFKYDAQNRLVTTLEYINQLGRVSEMETYTYDQYGNVFTDSKYQYDQESGDFEHYYTEAYFWSEVILSDIEDVKDNVELILAPNPVKVGAPISLTLTPGTVGMVEIYTIDGILVSSVRVNTSTISLSSPKVAGTYIVRFTTNTGKSCSSKLIVR